MTKDETRAKAQALYALASSCNVPMLQACKRIHMATSTPHRWRSIGSEPGPGQMDALRGSILREAAKRETLPQEYFGEFENLSDDEPERNRRSTRELVRVIKNNFAELEQVLAAGEG